MARTAGNDDLYKLIHSLSAEEKGYFKKFSSRHSQEENTYYKIFNDIANQEKFDEKQLKVNYKNYSIQKVYLFEAIMDSLIIYQRESEGRYNPHYNAIYYFILYKKNLLRKAGLYIDKTLEMVAEEEYLPMQIQFLEYKLNQEKRKWPAEIFWEKCSEIFDQINDLRKKELNRDKHSQIFHALYAMQMRKEQNMRDLPDPDKTLDISFLKNKKHALTITAARIRLFSLANYYKLKNDGPGVCKTYKELYYFEADCLNRKSLLTNVRFLSSALRGLLEAYLEVNEITKAIKIFDSDWTLATGNKENEFYNSIRGHNYNSYENYLYYCQYHSILCWHNRVYKKGLDLILKEEKKIINNPLNGRFLPQLVDIIKCKILFAYRTGNMQLTMLSINELEALGVKKNAPVVFKSCQWMKVLVQLQLKNFDIAQNLVNNMIRSGAKMQLEPEEKKCLMALKKKPQAVLSSLAGQIKIFGLMELNRGL